jgi:hypothetical protein
MIALSGIAILCKIYESSTFLVYRGIRVQVTSIPLLVKDDFEYHSVSNSD